MCIANTFIVSLEWIFDPQVLQFFRNLISRKKTGKRDRITSTTSSTDVSQCIMFLTSQLSTYTVASQVAKMLQLPFFLPEKSLLMMIHSYIIMVITGPGCLHGKTRALYGSSHATCLTSMQVHNNCMHECNLPSIYPLPFRPLLPPL